MKKKVILKRRMITMFDRKGLKLRAKLVLLRSYSKVFLACIIISLLSGGGLGIFSGRVKNVDLSAIPYDRMRLIYIIFLALVFITILLSIFMISPLIVGHKKFMIENSKSNVSLNLLLVPFNNGYKRIVFVQFMKNLFIFLWAIPALLPTVVLFFYRYTVVSMIISAQYGSESALWSLLGILISWSASTLILYIPAFIKELQYLLVPYMLADNPEITWRYALSESKEMMVGNKWAYIKLRLSFLPWLILANLACGVGGFFLAPYIEATVCEMYMELSGQTPTVNNVFYEQM